MVEKVWQGAQGSELRGKELAETCFHHVQCRIEGLLSKLEQATGERLEVLAKQDKNVDRSH